MGPRVDREQREAAMARLRDLREADALTVEHVRLVAEGWGSASGPCGGGWAPTPGSR
jgi:hypothetical protein